METGVRSEEGLKCTHLWNFKQGGCMILGGNIYAKM